MTTKRLLTQYNDICNKIVHYFILSYFCDEETKLQDIDMYAVGGELDGIWEISGYYISFSDMVTCLKFYIPEETFFAWYDHSLECHAEGKTYANVENYYLMTKNTL